MQFKTTTILDDGTSQTVDHVDQAAVMTAYAASVNNVSIVLFWSFDTATGTWFIGGPNG